MQDEGKSKQQLITELHELREQFAELEQKRVEEVLQESDEKYRMLPESIPGMVFQFVLHKDGSFSLPYVNERIMQYAGISAEAAMAEPALLFNPIHPDDKEIIQQAISFSARTLNDFSFEHRLIDVNGQLRWFRVESVPQRLSNGDTLWNGVSIDITAQKQAEEVLRESEEQFRTLVASAPDAILIQVEGRHAYVNDAAIRLYGAASEKELLGHAIVERIPPDHHAKVLERIRFINEEGKPAPLMEQKHVKLDGTAICVEVHSVPIRYQKTEGFLSFVRDITERKKAEESLLLSEDRYRRLFEDAVLGIFQSTPEGKLINVNPAYARMFGFDSPEEAKSQVTDVAVDLYVDPARRNEIVRMILDAKGPTRAENLYRRKDGGIFTGDLHAWVVRDREGKLLYLKGFVEDISDRKQAEEALRESEERYRQVVENVNEAIIVAQDGRLKFVNCVASRVFGYSEDELLSRPFADFIHRDDRSMVMDRHLRRLRGETLPPRYPFRLVGKDGGVRWVQIGAALVEWEGRAATLNLLTDITEHKRLEEKIREQVDFLQTLIDTIPNPIFHKDAKGRYAGFNQAFLEFIGRPMEEVLGKTVYDMAPKDIADKYEEKDRELFEHPGKQRYEWQVPNKLGEVREVIFDKATLLDAHAAVSGLIGVISDITERKQAEKALRESEEKYRSLFESSRDAIMTLASPSWCFATGNLATIEMFGIPSEAAFAALGPWELSPEFQPDGRPSSEKAAEIIQTAMTNGSHFFEWTHRRLGGESFPATVLLTRMEIGEETFIQATVRDITEQKRAEGERLRLEQQLQQVQKAESLGRMAGAIAHLFNNHLAVVIGNLELALMDLSGDAEIRKSLIEAMRAARRSSEISGLMLTYLGQTTDKGEPLDLSDVCRRNLPIFRDVMPEGIALETGLLSSGPVVRANPKQMHQVLTHLIINGWESMGHSAGTVTLATRIIPASEILKHHLTPVDWKPAEDLFSCLEVTDTGCGMAEEDLDKIFDPFYTTKFTGRGLGLAVVLGIVKTWGGAIGVESRKNQGSSFRVFLPLVTDELPRTPEKATEIHQMEQGGAVLLVEDQDMVREMAELMLKRLGYEVLAASNGAEAVELLRENTDLIRCVITDLSMPGMNGWETLTALRKIRPQIPVVLVSGHDEAHALGRGYAGQPHVFLHKPYLKSDLEAAIDTALKKPVSTI